MRDEEKTNELIAYATEIMNSGLELVDTFVSKNYLIELED